MGTIVRRAIVLLFFSVVALTATGAEVFVVEDQLTTSMNVGARIAYLRDGKHVLDIQQVKSLDQEQWQIFDRQVPSFGFDAATYWLKFELTSQVSSPKSTLLELSYPVLDEVEFYFFSNLRPPFTHLVGDNFPFQKRPIAHHNFVLPLEILPNEELQVYIRARTESSMQLPLTLWNPDAFYQQRSHIIMVQGLYFGMMVVMAIYNLFIYTAVRHRSYVYYTGAVVGIVFFMAAIHGFGFQYLWPNAPSVNQWAIVAALGLFGSCACAFTLTFLRLRQTSKFLYYLMLLHVILYSAIFLASFLLPYHYMIIIAVLTGFTACVSALIAGVVLLVRGQREARYYVLAYGSLLMASVMIALNKAGIIPRVFFTEYSMQIGSVMEVVLLSFALADRINIERRQKYAAKQQAIELEKAARDEHERFLQVQFDAKVEELRAQQKLLTAEAESKAKGEFLATMSHEIRTPMNGVLGMADLLGSTKLNEEQRKYLNVITSSGNALLCVINDVLDYSKIAAGKMDLESIDFNLKSLCEECIAILQAGAESKQLALRLKMNSDVPESIQADPTRLRQVLLNLMGNALKFTDKGYIELAVDLEKSQESMDAGMLRFSVKDTGIGISNDIKAQLFEAFTQADSSTTRKFGGTGLGLSISQNLIHMMGGQIGVNSQPEEGSTFWFTIKFAFTVASVPSTEKPRQSIDLVQARELLEAKRVLVVEDNLVNKMVISGYLKKLGITFEQAENGEQALNLLMENHGRAQLILMDCEMPVMDGYTATQKLRKFEADNNLHELPVLALTAHVLSEHRGKAEAAGMTDHLGKPVDFELLINLLVRHLGGVDLPDVSASNIPPTDGMLDTGTVDR